MCCLNLKRLLPARKTWKVLTAKLQTKIFHKLNRSKAIKKSKNPKPYTKASKKSSLWPVLRVQFKTKRANKFKQTSRTTFKYQKKPAPVYIDQLFIENIAAVVKEDYVLPMVTANKQHHKQVCIKADFHTGESSSSRIDEMANDQKQKMGADEMWESLIMASPQLHCINERAEEFITRFRADMQRQENLFAHGL